MIFVFEKASKNFFRYREEGGFNVLYVSKSEFPQGAPETIRVSDAECRLLAEVDGWDIKFPEYKDAT